MTWPCLRPGCYEMALSETWLSSWPGLVWGLAVMTWPCPRPGCHHDMALSEAWLSSSLAVSVVSVMGHATQSVDWSRSTCFVRVPALSATDASAATATDLWQVQCNLTVKGTHHTVQCNLTVKGTHHTVQCSLTVKGTITSGAINRLAWTWHVGNPTIIHCPPTTESLFTTCMVIAPVCSSFQAWESLV